MKVSVTLEMDLDNPQDRTRLEKLIDLFPEIKNTIQKESK